MENTFTCVLPVADNYLEIVYLQCVKLVFSAVRPEQFTHFIRAKTAAISIFLCSNRWKSLIKNNFFELFLFCIILTN